MSGRGVIRKGFSATKTLVSASAAPPVTLGASEGVNIPLDIIYVWMRSEGLFAWGLCLQPPGRGYFCNPLGACIFSQFQ